MSDLNCSCLHHRAFRCASMQNLTSVVCSCVCHADPEATMLERAKVSREEQERVSKAREEEKRRLREAKIQQRKRVLAVKRRKRK